MNKCRCGNLKEEWQEICKKCYAEKMNGNSKKKTVSKDNLILKQTCLKVAGNVAERKTASEVIKYAKELYNQFHNWN